MWHGVGPSLNPAVVAQQPRTPDVLVLRVDGALHARPGAALRKEVQLLLRRGVRTIDVCLADATKVDAGGIGELVRAYHLAVAAGGVLRVTEASERVRAVLACVGLLGILTGGCRPSAPRRL